MILLPLNEKAGKRSLRTRGRASVRRPERLGGVLDEYDLVARADLAERVVVAALAVQVDRDHRADTTSRSAPAGDRAVEELRIDRPRRGVRVDEHGDGSRVDDRVGGRCEGEVRAHDLVARPDPEDDEGKVQRRRPAREGDGVRGSRGRSQFVLEGIDVRPERRDPVGGDRLGHELGFASGEVGWGEVHARHAARA